MQSSWNYIKNTAQHIQLQMTYKTLLVIIPTITIHKLQYKLKKTPRLSRTYKLKFKDFQRPTLFSSTFKALNLEKNSRTFNDAWEPPSTNGNWSFSQIQKNYSKFWQKEWQPWDLCQATSTNTTPVKHTSNDVHTWRTEVTIHGINKSTTATTTWIIWQT